MNIAQKTKLYTEWYQRYKSPLMKYIKAAVTHNDFDYDELEDAAQETFMRVWNAMESFQGDSDPFTWICKVGRNAALRLLENKRRQMPEDYLDIELMSEYEPPEEADEEDEEIFTTDPQELHSIADWNTPEVVLMREQGEDEIDSRVQALPEHYREVMALHYYDGLTYDEIADKLDLPLETVRTQLRRGREKLKTFLGVEDESQTSEDETSGEHSGGERGVR